MRLLNMEVSFWVHTVLEIFDKYNSNFLNYMNFQERTTVLKMIFLWPVCFYLDKYGISVILVREKLET